MNAFYKQICGLLIAVTGCCEAVPFQLPSFDLNGLANRTVRGVEQRMMARQNFAKVAANH
jgi:hypothetical protein